MNEILITPLGTISPYLKDNRNCPGFLIEYGDSKILLDCGNGVTRLLKFPKILENLNIIITHYHKDHFSDIGSIQYASYVYHNLGLLNNRIKIMLPKNDIDFNRKVIISNNESYSDYFDIYNNYSININDLKISFEDNKSHSIESYMVKLENENFKIVYTSDVGITNLNSLVDFCRNSDLIICESSLLKKYNSLNVTHMTAYDAGQLASYSNAKKLLLTHFWPEEEKQLYLHEAKQVFNNVEIAEEGKIIVLKKNVIKQFDN